MPVVITDKTNKVWAVEDPVSGFVLAGYTGQPGPRLLDLLDFVAIRDKQFDKFVEKRQQEEERRAKRRRKRVITESSDIQLSED
ncbi:MAG: hypothetical protein V3V88_03620 [Dehalococcoidia bacterium]